MTIRLSRTAQCYDCTRAARGQQYRVETTPILVYKMRTQITAYLHADTKPWLQKYARECGMGESEVVRLLLEREKQVRWLRWALSTLDPAQGSTPPLPPRDDKLPPRWNKPPKKRPGRKRA
jgi:hypothetical protein